MWSDLRFAARTLRRSPVFTAVAVASLALGIGANTSIFSLLDQVLLRALPVRDPHRLVLFHGENRGPGSSLSDNHETVFSYPMYRDLRDRIAGFDGVAARTSAPVSLAYGGQTERAAVELVSGNFFQVLGVGAVLGRVIVPEDDGVPGAHPVAMLAHGFWMRRFGGSRAVLNQKIAVNGHPLVVIGVAAPGFRGVVSGQVPELYAPIAMKREITPTWDGLNDRSVRWLNLFARLGPGVSREQAEAAVQVVYSATLQDDAGVARFRDERARRRFLAQKLSLRPAAQGINMLRADWRTPLLALMALVALVLLIACANVASLMLARAARRRREVAIRVAIGAGRRDILRQLLLESLVLALAGGLAGLLVATWTTDALLRFLPEQAAGGWISARLDLRLLAFNLSLSAVTALLFGLAPALAAARADPAPVLRDQSAGPVWRGGAARFRKSLVVGQIALSAVLLIAAGLFARSLSNLSRADLGFAADGLLTFGVDPRLNGYGQERGIAFYGDLHRRLLGIPGVRAAGGAAPGPFSHSSRGGTVAVEGYRPKDEEPSGALYCSVTPGFFRALGIPLLAGREFSERDDGAAPRVVLVNESFARHYFGDRNPIGRHVGFGPGSRGVADREIVGVVGDLKYGNLREPPPRFVFAPYAQEPLDRMDFYVRTGEARLAPQIRALVRELDPNLPVASIGSLRARIESSIYADRLIAALSAAFGALATLLAAIGLYGVVAYTVARRTAEIGVRVALGALPRNVLWLVLRDVAVLAAAGLAVGLPAALALGRLVGSQLFGLQPHDPLVFAAAAAALAAVALAAGYLPGRRAARIDPVRALRWE